MTDTMNLAFDQEKNLIGSLLKNPDKLALVSEIITPDDIHSNIVQRCYKAMLELREKNLSIDTVTVGDELLRKGVEYWGEHEIRTHLRDMRAEFKGEYPESYAFKILDYSAKRKLLDEAGTMATWSNNGRNAADIRDDMIRRLTDIKVPNPKLDQHTKTFKEALSINYDEVSNGNIDFVPTGFVDLDKILHGGLYAPDLLLIAGRPGQGKTALLFSVAKSAAEAGKLTVAFSLEMSNSQVVMRLISSETGIPFGAMRSRKMTADEWKKYNDALEKMEHLPLHLNDLSAITVNQIRQTLRKIEAVHGKISLVVVDYIQLQGTDGLYKSREQEVSSVSRGLKGVAKEFDVPVLAAAQLSRAVEQRSEKRPVLSDLRESGSLEQDSDIVAFIHTPDPLTNVRELIVAKHRNGAVGSIDLIFRPERTKFENAATRVFQPRKDIDD